MAELSFGNADNSWIKQGIDIQEAPIMFNGEASGFKAIIHEGRLAHIASNRYVLLPNEKALEIADEAARLLKLEPFKFAEKDSHVIMNKQKTRMHAWYAPNKTFKVDQEEVKIGVDVRNSIDGSSSFGCGVFTYRMICSNGVILGKQKIANITRMHTRGLKPIISDLKNKMLLVMENAVLVRDQYERMAQEKITLELLEKLQKSRLSKKVLPDYASEEEITEIPDISEWQLYNDVTELIWHNDIGLKTKTHYFNTLHQVIPLKVK